MSRTRWIVFAVICAFVLGGLVVLANKDKKDVSSIDPSKIILAQGESIGDHVYGNKTAKVVVFEYGDFQCPSCGGAYPQLKAIKEQYKSQIAFVFRNFPLTSIHPNAFAASATAEAAGLQGKFWEMHDQLYDTQTSWSSISSSERNGIFAQYAANIGLNTDQYQKALTGKSVSEKIARDRALGAKVGVDATPSVFIGSTKISSDILQNLVSGDGSKLKAEIDKSLKAAGVELPAENQ